ncbi:hypothetical protein C8J57DRAFT_1541349 [Mycena rebaudengoi]|nr:hypothetical protein C8J57DRAFT_1541349 [Mycena rebaudengoi]
MSVLEVLCAPAVDPVMDEGTPICQMSLEMWGMWGVVNLGVVAVSSYSLGRTQRMWQPHTAAAPQLPVEVLTHVLSFIDEYDPPYSTQDYISFQGTLRLIFRCLVASVPCLWVHILLTPTLDFKFASLCFHLAHNYPTRIHVRATPNSAFHSFCHNGLTVYQHYRRLLHLAASVMSTCTEITVETQGVPSILSRISVVFRQDPPDF